MALVALTALLTACSSAATQVDSPTGQLAPRANAKATFTGHGSIGQAYVLGAAPGTHLVLANAAGDEVGSGAADGLGSLIVRGVAPGPGYTFRAANGRRVASTASFRVLAPVDTPPRPSTRDST